MSRRFDKTTPEEFGLVKESNKIISPKDHSVWEEKKLYDFGWGKEYGFYKKPLPNFSNLIRIIFDESDEDDIYGAASIILELYSQELLLYLEALKVPTSKQKEKLNNVFNLQKPINRSLKNQMTIEEVFKENERWLKISKIFQD